MWFRVCYAANTQYFIPFKLPAGRDRQSLVNEVCSLRTEDYRRQIAKEDSEQAVTNLKRDAVYSTVLIPLNVGLIATNCFTARGGCWVPLVSPDDFEHWLHKPKKAHGSR